VGWTLERPANLLNSLAAAGLVILMMDPRQLFQAGFQLSFFVVLGLALIVPPLERARQRLLQPDPLVPPELRPRWKRWLDLPIRLLTTSLATSLAAWLGSMPLIAYYFSMVTPGSLLANLVIVPLSSVALMSSLGSLACGTWFPFPGELFNHSSWLWMRLMIGLSEWFASLPGAFFYVRPPGIGAFFAYYLLLGGLLSGVFFKPRWRSLAMLGALLTLGAWLFHWHVERQRIRITALPMRAGAVFVDQPGSDYDLLVDCGDEATARSQVKPFLKSQGINRLSALLLTQGDVQHVGGAQLISREFRVRQILTSPLRFRSPAYREILAQLEQTPQRWHRVQRGDQTGPWTVLHPAPEDKFPQAADSALVLRASFFGTRVLLISKLGRLGQRKLLERETNLGADILIGAATPATEALSDAFLEAVRPRVLILGGAQFALSDRQNRELRQRLARVKIPVLFTSEIGAAILIVQQGGWFVQTTDGQPVPLPSAPAVGTEQAARLNEEEAGTPSGP
jgi:competence protein ComEC